MFKRKILVVDDQIINRKILGRLLADEYEVLEAENGKLAIECMRSHKDISAVLLDIVMPVMNGHEVLKLMQKDSELSKIPVIVSSQDDGDDAEVMALSLGAQDFIAKPYKGDIIRHRLKNTIRLRETAAMVNKAERDEVTGLYNKQFFIAKADELLKKNTDRKYIMLCVGVERFKLVNDTYGAHRGDELLHYIAGVLHDMAGEGGVCGHFHSDLFYVLMPGKDSYVSDDFQPLVDKINCFPIEMNIKINCGLYEINDITVPVAVMCDRAQLAADKNRGKYDANFSVYDDSIRDKLFEEQFITSVMQSALEQKQFIIYYQPKYDLHTEMVAGAEALVRWIHPEKGFLSPGAFIPLFEKNGFITQLDQYVWEKVCSDLREWMDKGYPVVPISINVSRADIFNPRLPEILTGLIEQYNIPIAYLHLEITESAYTDNPEQIVETVDRLHKLGFVIEMDDFGSGYSSLNMLAELPVDILKMDMRFVQSEATNTSGRGVMNFVISLAKWMELSVIAEGVETAAQIALLRSMDCNFVQGFYYAKPMPKAEFENIINTVAVIRQIDETELAAKQLESKPKVEKGNIALVVDDLEINRKVLAVIFEDEYEVVEKENGLQALEYLRGNYQKVDVILLDLLMPVMDGFQMLERLKNDDNLRKIPVIVTSQGDVDVEEKALDMGADDFISKPYRPQIVSHRVNNVVEAYRLNSLQQRELSATRKKEQTLMESIPGGVAVYHLKKDGSLPAEYVSDGLARLCGYGAAEFLEYLQNDARINIMPTDIPHLTTAIENSLIKDIPLHELAHIYTKEHKTILVRFDANIISNGKMAEDDKAILYVVHTKMPDKIENSFQEQNRYRYILDNLDVAYFEFVPNDKFYTSDKYSLYVVSEEKAEAILEDNGIYNGVHPDDLPAVFEFFRLKKNKMPKISMTLRLKMKDGSYRWTEMMCFFEYNECGELNRVIGVLRDVDKEWINQNRRLQNALDAAEMANLAKTNFLARVSHNMRTPLNGILGLTALMEGKKAGSDIEFELEQLKQSGKYLLNMIDDTLDVSTIEQGKMELHPSVCDGKTALQNVLSLVRPSMDAKRIQFKMHIDDLPFTKLYIDIGRVEQAIMNVLSNAVKFTPEGGNISLKIENVSQKNGIITDKLTIADDGIGMSEEFLEHIFEPFSQEYSDNKSIYRGTGLGMTIVKQCIDLMGGSISVVSEKGRGTEVTIILPMPVATRQQLDEWHNQIEQTDISLLKGKRILLCEDHPLNAEIAIKVLERKGMKVERAENGKVGVDMYMASPLGWYDAVLMDIRMPVMDGLEASRRIRSLNRKDAQQIPILAMTANVLSDDVKNAINAGMSEHLGKPVEPSRLYRSLAELIAVPKPFVGGKVLIVDDIKMNRAAVKAALEEFYTVIEAGNGAEALEELRQQSDIVAIVTDIQMPVMDGKELIKNIRAEHQYDDVAILANTVYGDQRQEEELLAMGVNDFVYKPTSPRIIQMRLEHILRNI